MRYYIVGTRYILWQQGISCGNNICLVGTRYCMPAAPPHSWAIISLPQGHYLMGMICYLVGTRYYTAVAPPHSWIIISFPCDPSHRNEILSHRNDLVPTRSLSYVNKMLSHGSKVLSWEGDTILWECDATLQQPHLTPRLLLCSPEIIIS